MTELQEKIRQVVAQGPRMRLVILFGSRARGSARSDSDIDLAILPVDPALSLEQEGRLASELERATSLPIDLVRLDRAEGALRWRVARDGIVLLSDPPWEAPRFLARAGIEHDALRELELDAMRRFRARLMAAQVVEDGATKT